MTLPFNPLLPRCPLLVFPAVEQTGPADFSFRSGLFQADADHWDKPAWATGVSYVTGEGETIGRAVRFNFTSSNGYINQGASRDVSAFWTPAVANSFPKIYWYARIKCKTASGTPSFAFRVDFFNSSNTLLASSIQTINPGSATLPADNVWRIIRIDAGAMPANTAKVQLFVGNIYVGTDTNDVYLDWVLLGNVLDFQENDPAPAFFTECPIDWGWNQEFNDAEDASVKGPGWSPPVASGHWKTSEVAFSFYQAWRILYAQIKDGDPFTWFRAAGDFSQESELAAVLRQDHDGAAALKGKKTYTLEAAWSGVPLGSVSTAPNNKVVEIVGLVGGTASAYLASASVPGIPGSSSNVYPYLDPLQTKVGDQILDDLEGTTEWPGLAIRASDKGAQLTALLAGNYRTAWQYPVFLWEGLAGANFSTYARRFVGFLDSPDQVDSDGLSYTISALSQFDRLKQPLEFVPASCQLKAALTTSAPGAYLVKGAVNLDGSSTNLFASGGTEETSFEAGSDNATPQGWTTPDGTPKLFKTSSRHVPVSGTKIMANTSGTNAWYEVYREYGLPKFGTFFFFSVSALSSDGSAATFELVIEGRDGGGSLVDSASSGILTQPLDKPLVIADSSRPFWTKYGVLYEVTNTSVATLRCRIRSNDGGSGQTAPEFDDAKLQLAQIMVCEREVFAGANFQTKGRERALFSWCQRGLFGSQPMDHPADAECYKIIALRGHPLNLMRRLITTSLWVNRGAWSNATAYKRDQYDSSTGARLGADAVTYGGSQWRCLRDHTNQTPVEGVYWTKVSVYDAGDGFGLGDFFPAYLLNDAVWDAERDWKSTASPGEFSDFDHSAYRYDLRLDAKIDNLLEFLETEFLKPLHANLYQDENGLLCIRLHRAIESAGATWSSGTAYKVGDFALHASTGLSWRCIQAHTNQTPAEGAYWTRNYIGKGDIFPGAKLAKFRANLDRVRNWVVFQGDYESHGAVDVQGNKTNGGTKYLTQAAIDENALGHDPSDSAPRSIQLYGLRQIELAARGIRGTQSARFGLSSNLGGDQLMREVSRRIITRLRHPLQEYDVEVDWAAQTIPAAAPAQVTSDAMTNLFGSAGNWRKRVNAAMQIFRRGVNSPIGRLGLTLRAVQDVIAIPNTAAASALTAPTTNEFRAIIRNKTNGSYPDPLYYQGPNWDDPGMGYMVMPFFPKGAANVVWVQLFAGSGSAPTSTSTPAAWTTADLLLTRVYAARKIFTAPNWSSVTAYVTGDLVTSGGKYWRALQASTNHTPAEDAYWTEDLPLAGEYELVCEIPKGAVEGYFVGFSCTTSAFGISRTYVKLCHVNLDHVETTKSSPLQVATPTAPVSMGSRYPKKEIAQYNADRRGEANRY